MPAIIRLFPIALALLVSLGGCATMTPKFENPSISVRSIKLINSGGITPQFDVVLRVANPNKDVLPLKGMSYAINLSGNKVITGTANDLPTIKAYGETDITIQATMSLFAGLSLINKIMQENLSSIDYEFIAKLDIGRFYPDIHIKELGAIDL